MTRYIMESNGVVLSEVDPESTSLSFYVMTYVLVGLTAVIICYLVLKAAFSIKSNRSGGHSDVFVVHCNYCI